jgi:hypothetical protein
MTDQTDAPVTEAPPEVEAPPAPAQTFADLREADPKAKIPGLELTWEDAEILELADDAIQELVQLKATYKVLHLVPSDVTIYVFRSCSRLSWRKIAAETLDMDKSKEQFLEESGGNPQAANLILNMIQEERLVQRLLVKPQLTKQEILELPPGEVKHLYDSLMRSLGYDQPIRAIRI